MSLAILILIFAIITINISPLPSNALQSSALDVLMSDIRSQQSLAMSNDSSYGIHFESSSYTLFTGGTYAQGSASNFVVNLDGGIGFTNVTFPNSQIIFLPGSGDISDYSAGSDSFTLASSVTNKSSFVRIDKYGATY